MIGKGKVVALGTIVRGTDNTGGSGAIALPNQLIVYDLVWSGTGYEFIATVEVYREAGVEKVAFFQETVTLDPADGAQDRYDTFYFQLNEDPTVDQILVLKGDLGAYKKELDGETQLEIGFVKVAAGTTEPEGVTVIDVYQENIEWVVTTEDDGGTIDPASADAPLYDTVSIKCTNVPHNSNLKFTAPAPLFTDSEYILLFDLLLDTEWEFKNSNRITLDIYTMLTGVVTGDRLRVGSDFGFGFDGSLVGTIQTVAVRLARLPGYFNENTFDGFLFRHKRTSNEVFRIDNVRITKGYGSTVTINEGSEDEYTLALDGNGDLILMKNGLPLTPAIPILGQGSSAANNTVIDLTKALGTNYITSGNASLVYTTAPNPVINGWARVFINAASEPTITGATKEAGTDFIENTDMYMIVYYNGTTVNYYFIHKTAVATVNNLQKEVTDTYVVLPEDDGYTIWLNKATAFNVTVDNTLPDNFECGFMNIGAGTVTFIAGTATLSLPDGLDLETNKVATLLKYLTNNQYYIKGELTTP